jgi:hypothetical protein
MAILAPLETRDAYLAGMKELGDRYYDPAERLLTYPVHPNVHTDYLPPGVRHCTRESLYYALVLLLIGGTDNVARAAGIVDRMVDAQEQGDPEHQFYGLWHYFAEESVLTWPTPDSNWADFNGLTLLLIWHIAGARLDGSLRGRMREAIRRATVCIRRKNTSPHYTNIALKGTFVTMAAAELLEDDSLLAYGQDRMRRIAETFRDADSFAEYNSPTYAAVSLASLGAIQTFVRDEEVKALALGIQHSFWRHIGLHFHVPTGELVGPHSRAYHLMLRESPAKIGSLIERATEGLVRYPAVDDLHDAFGPVFTCSLDFDVPADVGAFFLNPKRIDEVREVARRFPAGGATRTTSHLCPEFCIGTVNFQDGWEQRHNLMGYWRDGNAIGYLRHRYLHDSRPCAGGWFTAAQSKGRILAASFLGDFADDHPCFQTEGVTASYMGPVLELGVVADPLEIIAASRVVSGADEVALHEGETLFLRLPTIWIACTVLRNRSGLLPKSPAFLRRGGSGWHLAFPHHEGKNLSLKWTDFIHAETAYGLTVEVAGNDWPAWRNEVESEATHTVETVDALRIDWAGLQVSMPNRVVSQGAARDFYQSGPPWDTLAPRRPLP